MGGELLLTRAYPVPKQPADPLPAARWEDLGFERQHCLRTGSTVLEG